MRLTTILVIVAGLLIAGVVAIVVALKSIDLAEHRELIARAVGDATGRELVLAGAAELEVSMAPKVIIGDVSFANADWGSGPSMLAAKRIEAQIELLPLLVGTLSVSRLILVEPTLVIEIDPQGRGNWEFDSSADALGGDVVVPSIGELLVSDGRLTYRDGRSGETYRMTLRRLSARADGLSGPLDIAVTGGFEDIPFTVEGSLGSVAELTNDKPYSVDLHGEVGEVKIAVQGSIRRALAGEEFDFTIAARGDTLGALSPVTGRELPDFGPYDARFRLTDPDGRLAVSDIAVELGTKGDTFVTIAGKVRDALTASGLDLNIGVESRDTATLAAIAGANLPSLGALTFSANLTDTDGAYRFNDAHAAIGDSDLSGKVAVHLAAGRPKIEAELASSRTDVDALLGLGTDPAVDAGPAGEGDRVFSADPLPFDALGAIDGKLSFRGESVVIGGTAFKTVVLEADLESGLLRFDLREAAYGTAQLSAKVVADARQSEPQLSATVAGSGINFGRLLTETGITNLIEGKANVAADLRGSGRSLGAIMAGLDGRFGLVMGEGRVGSGYVDLLAADLVQSIAPWSGDGSDAKVNCLVGRFSVADGLATSDGLLFDTKRMTVAGTGTINLASEKLDLIFKPKPKDPSLLSLATPIRLGGTLAKPRASPDSLAVAKKAAGVVLGAIATGGIGLIVPFVSLGSGGDNPCLAALAAAPDAPGNGQDGKATTGLGGVLKGVGGAIGEFLGAN